MKSDDDLLVYDDDEVVNFIMGHLDPKLKERIDEDVVNYILDVQYDFYEEKGLINNDSAEEASIDEDEMLNYVVRAALEDGHELSVDDIVLILDAEYEYGKSQGIYSDEDE